jgi:protein-tyrosine phosphatase
VNQVSPFSVLFVCTGNICRSPLGERLLAARLHSSEFEVTSAGVMAMVGQGMDPEAAQQLHALGGDDTGFVAQQVNEKLIGHADLVLTATRAHRERVLEERPGALRRTFTVLEFADLLGSAKGSTPAELVAWSARHRSVSTLREIDIPDPYRGGDAIHAEVAGLINGAVERIVHAFTS